MKLVQKRFLRGQAEFELTDTALKVSHEKLFNSTRFEVPLESFRPEVTYVRNFPIAQLLAAIVSWGSCLLLVISLLHGDKTGKSFFDTDLGVFVFFLLLIGMSAFFGLAFLLNFLRRNVDCFLLQSRGAGGIIANSGNRRRPPAILGRTILICRQIPSERHVQEFLDIFKEKVAELKFKSSDPS